MTDLSPVHIYTDGGCDPNPGPGGWGAVLLSGRHRHELHGAELHTTNNRMELTAAIEALRALTRPCTVEVTTDSQYLHNGIERWVEGWRRRAWRKANGQPVENIDLWQELIAQAERHTIAWRWIRGHAGHAENERADALARQARRELLDAGRGRAPSPGQRARPPWRIYTRGCVLENAGGYGAVLVGPGEVERTVSAGEPHATNNAMELAAAVAALAALAQPSDVTIVTPSKYLLDGATKWLVGWQRSGWRTRAGEPVRNRERWQALAQALGQHTVHWEHVDAQRSAPSQRAAELARRAAEQSRDATN